MPTKITITMAHMGKNNQIVSIIRDGIAATNYSMPQQLNMCYNVLKKQGKDVHIASGLLIEKSDSTAEHLVKERMDEIEMLKKQYPQLKVEVKREEI